jgi:hypothetical protein
MGRLMVWVVCHYQSFITERKAMQGTIDKLKKIGFKKVPTEKGFVMYELTPARLNGFDSNFRAQDPIKKKVKR